VCDAVSMTDIVDQARRAVDSIHDLAISRRSRSVRHFYFLDDRAYGSAYATWLVISTVFLKLKDFSRSQAVHVHCKCGSIPETMQNKVVAILETSNRM